MADVILTNLLEDSLLLLKTKDGKFSFKRRSGRVRSQQSICNVPIFVFALSKTQTDSKFVAILSFALPQPNPDFIDWSTLVY